MKIGHHAILGLGATLIMPDVSMCKKFGLTLILNMSERWNQNSLVGDKGWYIVLI